MRYIKTYENFQTNEEISLKGLAPIVASLFLTFNSFGKTVTSSGGTGEFASQATQQINSISDKIEKDLEKLKSETADPKLLELIKSVQSLKGWQYTDGMDKVDGVIKNLETYIQSQNINDPLINKTLNDLSSGDVKVIKSDYEKLLGKYKEISTQSENMALRLVFISILVICFIVMLGKSAFREFRAV